MDYPYKRQRNFLVALEPVHVGAGSYRIGLVDNTIVREPHTNLPKIPGTSLSGVARAYAALACDVANPPTDEKLSKYLNCSGKGGPDGNTHCGEATCPVCTTFGFSRGDKSSFQGLAAFSDAHLLFFPVHSMNGPVWITCPAASAEFVTIDHTEGDKAQFADDSLATNGGINLGWRWFDKKVDGDFGNKLKDLREGAAKLKKLADDPNFTAILTKRLVLISDLMFEQVVNDNLEVRTSVAINPKTGAAEDKALFSYEALPRGTILTYVVTATDPKHFRILAENGEMQTATEQTIRELKIAMTLDNVLQHATEGFDYLSTLGLGGMGTRGFGRVKHIAGPVLL